MKYIGLILLAVLAVIVLLLLIAVLRTLLMPSKTSTYVADEPGPDPQNRKLDRKDWKC